MFGLFRKKLPTAGAAAPSAPVRADEDLATPASFRDFEFGPEMVVVPAGEFLMGGGISSTEHPVHRISIDRPFAVSRFPVTCDEWDRAVAACVADEKKAYF